ncbi:MAG: hypothetical protein HYV09_05855 [Deltaproteobacteria bacterium]|nr:hypothetical protein [Deltaproteobacteria bacterium]
MRVPASRVASLIPLALAACGPATPAQPPPKAPAAAPSKPAAPVESPARWSLHTARVGNLRARLDLGTAVLFGGDGGERWLDKRDGAPPQPGSALVPEAIVGIAKGGGKAVWLVGASGTVYVAADPIGAIDKKNAPPSPVRSPAAGRAAVVAIADGGLLRTADAGVTWSKIDLPGAAGTIVQLAMNDAGMGVALAAPQRAWATDDDGATWKAVPTPGIGARRLVLDVNGDLMIEGVEASAILKGSPLRLERVARAPKSDGFEFGASPHAAVLGWSKAIATGRGAMIGDRYLEAIADPDDPTRWRVGYGKIGTPIEPKKVAELNGCERVWAGGDETALLLACDDRNNPGKTTTFTAKPKTYAVAGPSDRSMVRLLRSDDEGKTWRDDATLGSRRADVGHVWVAPDKSVIVDGACKRLRSGECYESMPLVRPAGAKAFAKIGVKGRIQSIHSMAFAPQGGRAYALGRSYGGPLQLLVSKNGGKDFTPVPLPSVAAADPKAPALSAARAEPGSVSVDSSGLVVATAIIGGEWVVYTSKDDGATLEATRVPHHADGLGMWGKRGLAWARDGRGWETSDAGATWVATAAPAFPDAGALDRSVVCGAYGCFVGDRATRIGWGTTAAVKSVEPPQPKVVAASPLACSTEGEWKQLGALLSPPSAYDVDQSTSGRWTAIRHDVAKGSVTVLLGKSGAKGVEVKEVPLFGPAAKDTATAVLPQIEGAAAIRYAFKREPPPKEDPKDKDAKDAKLKKPKPAGAIVDGQKVDVEVAWWVASTGAVHKARITGVGPLDSRDVVASFKDGPALANVSLLSIAQGGVHVRPLVTRAEVPLWFVREGGKVERLSWPEIPTKDIAGNALAMRVDAVRAAGRSVVLGVAGAQLWMAWANETGTAWDTRTWGLWPELRGTPSQEASWDFTYVPSATGLRATVVAQWPGGSGVPPAAWGAVLKGVEVDPSEVVGVPTQKLLGDNPSACAATDTAPRVVAPWSVGTRHAVVVTHDGAEALMGTSFAVLRGDTKKACVVAYEARPIARTKGDSKADSKGDAKPAPSEEGALSALVPWSDREHAFLFRSTLTGETSVRSLRCVAAKEQPTGLSGVEGFDDR